MKISSSSYLFLISASLVLDVHAFVTPSSQTTSILSTSASSSSSSSSKSTSSTSSSKLFGLFDNWGAGGSGKDNLDEEWQKQQEILARRRAPKSERDAYFRKVEESRKAASKKQSDMWSWQTKSYGKGEDPITEWKKRRQDGTISDLENQYGDPKKIGGIPIPGASFGVGGEFGVGGKFDNGGRFDLRLPYADQGYVDDDADFMGKLFGKKKKEQPAPTKQEEKPKKKGGWPW